MKENRLAGAGIAVLAVVGGWQFVAGDVRAAEVQSDSVVAIVAEAAGLERVSREVLPPFGLYWEVRNSLPCGAAPLPCVPLDLTVPVYAIAGNKFLVDESGGPLKISQEQLTALGYPAILQLQVAQLADFITTIQAREAAKAAAAALNLAENGEPPPGEGEEWGGGLNGPIPTTNDLWLEVKAVTNRTAAFVIHPPWTGGNAVYDLFSTTNLVPTWWTWLVRTQPGQTNITLTNLTAAREFFVLGMTNDLDGGGLTDAYEKLLGLNPTNNSDDRELPLVSISTADSIAMELEPTDTASFLVTRLGGHLNAPLTVALDASGTAIAAVNYSLAPGSAVAITGTNVFVTLAAGQTNMTVTLTAINDSVVDGTKTATLTVESNAGWEVSAAHGVATAWILESFSYTYTTVAQFNEGVLDGLEAVSSNGDDGHLAFKTNLPPQFPFVNVACSWRGTVARINTTNGIVVGEYRTAPLGLAFTGKDDPREQPSAQPSRTTVDQYGNVWVANRDDDRIADGMTNGSIVRIGVIIGGSRFEKIGGSYVPTTNGHYVALSNAVYNTCTDRDNDGFICTSAGLGDILPWNNGAGVDSTGGVSTAEDEAIAEYTRVPCTGTRTIAVDKFNDIWVGGHEGSRTHLKVNGLLAQTVPGSAFVPFDPGSGTWLGGYGGLIDAFGNLWSSGGSDDGGYLLWLRPPSSFPPQRGTDWRGLVAGPRDSDGSPVIGYGIAVDPLHRRVWQTTSGDSVFIWNTNGTPVTNSDGTTKLFYHGSGESQGLAVDTNGHVWVSHHKENGSLTIGHLDTNGVWLGNVDLRLAGLRAEYFSDFNFSAPAAQTNIEGPINFNGTNGWPGALATNNVFSVKWTGFIRSRVTGTHVIYVRKNAGSIVSLEVASESANNYADTQVTELATTNYFQSNVNYLISIQYQNALAAPALSLLWALPGTSNKTLVPRVQLRSSEAIVGATGISIDAAGRVWASCYDSNAAVRVDPNGGDEVVVAGVTNHVGLMDMVVDLDAVLSSQPQYHTNAHPYNYSDMTGFNMRIVNPSLKPLKGYWMAIKDSGSAGQLWNKVSWHEAVTNGCAVEAYVRASDERDALGTENFVQATNGVFFPSIRGRFMEVRLSMQRDDPLKQPVVYDLTLSGVSSGFRGDYFLDDTIGYETQDGTFYANITGAEPLSYEWVRRYPWETNWVRVAGATNSTLTISNVDSWVDLTEAKVQVSNGNGESLSLGPASLEVWPSDIALPGSGSFGAASRYPASINVFGQPSGLNSVAVTLWGLSHTRSADLSVLLLSPSGKRVILMSNVGGTNGVSDASLRFWQSGSLPVGSSAIPSGQTTTYSPSNYGQKTPQIPFGLPAGPYSRGLSDLQGDDPNGSWKLYIYDDLQPGGIGQLTGSWSLDLVF